MPPSRNSRRKIPPASSIPSRPSLSPGHPANTPRTIKPVKRPLYVSQLGIRLPRTSLTAPTVATTRAQIKRYLSKRAHQGTQIFGLESKQPWREGRVVGVGCRGSDCLDRSQHKRGPVTTSRHQRNNYVM